MRSTTKINSGTITVLLYINDLTTVRTTSLSILFADDTDIFLSGKILQSTSMTLNKQLTDIYEWLMYVSRHAIDGLNLPTLALWSLICQNITTFIFCQNQYIVVKRVSDQFYKEVKHKGTTISSTSIAYLREESHFYNFNHALFTDSGRQKSEAVVRCFCRDWGPRVRFLT